MFALIVLAGALSASSITLQSDSFGNRYVRVAEAAGGDLVVHVESADKNLPAVLGKVSPMGRDLIFVPRYPFQPGVRYEVSVLSPVRLTKTLRIPELVAQAFTTSSRSIRPPMCCRRICSSLMKCAFQRPWPEGMRTTRFSFWTRTVSRSQRRF